MAQQNGSPHLSPTIERDDLGGRGAGALQDGIQEGQFSLAVDKHGAPPLSG